MNFRPQGAPRKRWVTATLDITPLVDVIFQLLIFFFYTANFIQNPNIPVKLARSSTEETSTERKNRIVTIKKDGQIVFEGKTVDLKGLKAQLARIATTQKDTRILIRSDSGSHVGRLVHVMDAAREAGLLHIGIATRPRGAPGEP